MDQSDIDDLLEMADKALKHAKEAERWAQIALSGDQTGGAHQAWQCAGKAVRELKQLREALDDLPAE